jgi:hypothetical protein
MSLEDFGVLISNALAVIKVRVLCFVLIYQREESSAELVTARSYGPVGAAARVRAYLVASRMLVDREHVGEGVRGPDSISELDAPCNYYLKGRKHREEHGGGDGNAPPVEVAPSGPPGLESWAVHQWAAGWAYQDLREDFLSAQKAANRAEEEAKHQAANARQASEESERFRQKAEALERDLHEAQQRLMDERDAHRRTRDAGIERALYLGSTIAGLFPCIDGEPDKPSQALADAMRDFDVTASDIADGCPREVTPNSLAMALKGEHVLTSDGWNQAWRYLAVVGLKGE